MNMVSVLFLTVGVFLGNWIIFPLVSKRPMRDGFFIGLIAAALVLLFTQFFVE